MKECCALKSIVLILLFPLNHLLAQSPINDYKFIVNVKDYGATGDGKANDRGAFARALTAIQAQNGGKLFVPKGIYRINAPIIIRSNVIVEGEGKQTVILNTSKGSPWGNCIHVGVSREFSDWSGTINKITDADFTQFDKGDYSNITTQNVIVRNLCTKSANVAEGGLGVFVQNARNVTIENIWGDGNATPVNVGNDVRPYNAACKDVLVSKIYALSPGRWYDLVFVGMAEDVDVEQCHFDSPKGSVMREMITIGGRNCKVHDNYLKASVNSNKKGIQVTSPVFGSKGNNEIYNNKLIDLPIGIVLYNSDNNIVRENEINNVKIGLHIYSRNNQIIRNKLSNNARSLILETDAAHGKLIDNSGIAPATIQDKSGLLKTYKSQ